MRRHGPVNIIVYHPKTHHGQEFLARRVAEVHANAVTMRLKQLNCPEAQKLQLLDTIIQDIKAANQKNPLFPGRNISSSEP